MQTYLYIDASEFNDLAEEMRKRLTPQNFDKLMRRTLNEVGKRSKKPIREAVKQEYEVKSGWINKGIKSARISGGGGNIVCRIPLASEKGNIGSTFHAAGGARGWNPPKYKVTARIVKGSRSKMPAAMTHQGGQPPFRNLAFSGVTFTRKSKARLPIARVSGLALPQMPLNRASNETQDKILEVAEKRLIHNFSRIFD